MTRTNEPQKDEPVLDQKRQQQAKELTRFRRFMAIIEYFLAGAMLLILIFTDLSRSLVKLFDLPLIPQATIYLIFLILVFQIILTPVSYYRDFVLGHRFGLSTQSFGEWAMDETKSTGLSLILGAAGVTLLYVYISVIPSLWWLAAWGTMVLLTIVTTNLAPVLLVPIFFKMKPLDDPGIKTRLETLSVKAKTNVRGIFLIEFSRKGATANAALMGLGNTLRIVLSDTLLQQYSPEEIEAITAHELGHHTHNDVFRLLIVQSIILLIVFYLGYIIFKSSVIALGFHSVIDVAAFPWLLLIFAILGFLIMPLINTLSRFLENQADDYSLKLTDDPESFTTAMAKLIDQNLAEKQSSRLVQVLFHDHPSYEQREQHAHKYARSKSTAINKNGDVK